MEFVLNNQLIKLRRFAAHTTVLRYLREQRNLCGTKEGCASGDCGACTVLVGELNRERIDYQSVNACIAPLGAVHGKHVVTIEHLQQADRLHPAQQAFVDCHASQCGFCTPGFIMSLTAYCSAGEKQHSAPEREKICRAISGNLCRCTGYRPIIEAGLKAARAEPVALHKPETTNHLKRIQHNQGLPATETAYFRPQTLQQWQQLKLRHPDTLMVAGGTDLVLQISTQYKDLPQLIDISGIEELQCCELGQQRVTLGAGLSYSAVERQLEATLPQFVALLQQLGSPQIRNRGTLGGNIANASPVADTPPMLLALDATLKLLSSSGDYRELPLDEFYLAYKKTQLQANEMIVSLSLPRAALRDFLRFYKITKRYDDDIASVMAAFRFSLAPDNTICSARIAYGGLAATPLRVPAAEQSLIDQSINDPDGLEPAIAVLQNTLQPIDDVRASSNYRRSMALNLLRKAWLELGGSSLPSVHPNLANHSGVQRA